MSALKDQFWITYAYIFIFIINRIWNLDNLRYDNDNVFLPIRLTGVLFTYLCVRDLDRCGSADDGDIIQQVAGRASSNLDAKVTEVVTKMRLRLIDGADEGLHTLSICGALS